MSFESKKEAAFRILQILWNSKNGERMTLRDIIKRLKDFYNIELERKAVIRDIALLNEIGKEAGFEIETTQQGSCLVSRLFTDAELCLLIDNVHANRDLADRDKAELIEKIGRLSSITFRNRQRRRNSNDGERLRWKAGSRILDFVAKVNDAIESGKMVEYDYGSFGVDRALHPKTSRTICPFCLLQHNQRYYLMGFDSTSEELVYDRMNRVSNLKISEAGANQQIRGIKGFERGIDSRVFDFQMPYMFSGQPQPVTIRAKSSVMDQIVDWFGKDVQVEERGNDTVIIRLRSNLTAMRYWALQYAESIEVLSPPNLREEMRITLGHACKTYETKPTK